MACVCARVEVTLDHLTVHALAVRRRAEQGNTYPQRVQRQVISRVASVRRHVLRSVPPFQRASERKVQPRLVRALPTQSMKSMKMAQLNR